MTTPRPTSGSSSALDLPGCWSKARKVDGNAFMQLLVAPQRSVLQTRSGKHEVRTSEGMSFPVVISRRGLPAHALAVKVDAPDLDRLSPVVSPALLSWSGDREAVSRETVLAS